MSFTDQVVLVTGGGSGMGRLAAQRMADAGAKVAAVDVNEVGLAETAEGREGIFEWADRLAIGPPLAYRAAKASVYEGRNLSLENALDLESRHQRAAGRSRDVIEGVRAFLQKRKPEFRGH